mgnify:CR=1 FL=1
MTIPIYILHQDIILALSLSKGFEFSSPVSILGYEKDIEKVPKLPDRTFFIVDEKLLSKSSYIIAEYITKNFNKAKILALGHRCLPPSALREKNISSFLFLDSSFEEYNQILNKVDTLDDCYFDHIRHSKSDYEKLFDALSGQEKVVASLITEGALDIDIAKHLNVVKQSIQTYKSRIREKLQKTFDLAEPIDNKKLVVKLVNLKEEGKSF